VEDGYRKYREIDCKCYFISELSLYASATYLAPDGLSSWVVRQWVCASVSPFFTFVSSEWMKIFWWNWSQIITTTGLRDSDDMRRWLGQRSRSASGGWETVWTREGSSTTEGIRTKTCANFLQSFHEL